MCPTCRHRDHTTEDLALGEFLDRCEDYFAAGCTIVDQPFATRLDEGMIRYLVEDKVVGYARQRPAPAAAGTAGTILGMPSAKTMSDADDPTSKDFAVGSRMSGSRAFVRGQVSVGELPILWDADFLYGDPTVDGDDTYMLCEINASSVLPFPPGVHMHWPRRWRPDSAQAEDHHAWFQRPRTWSASGQWCEMAWPRPGPSTTPTRVPRLHPRIPRRSTGRSERTHRGGEMSSSKSLLESVVVVAVVLECTERDPVVVVHQGTPLDELFPPQLMA